ncbi:CHASE2 domain-containing protein [Caballeronia insecticola]|uniref:Putative Chase2 sensor protein n=1 Tax=Caballeronia insecticola TaxID=758793 RepID=R4WQC9_9BURK|nr:CHASE2 domain-containing protein [Caballeronia insecticola]BAN26893.1 putative Chase2 sensor protein [Caballeronia insecticola]
MAASNQEETSHEQTGLRSPGWMFFWRLLSTILMGCLVALVLPSRFTEELGAQKIAKLAAPLEGAWYGTKHRDEITVLLIDEKSLAREAVPSWPAPFDYYAMLLRAFVNNDSYHPRAVFFDIVFEHKQAPDALKKFETEIDKIDKEARGPHPVVFLAARRDRDDKLTIGKELDDFPGATRVAIEYSPNEVDHITWTYRLFFEEAPHHSDDARTSGIKRASAAESTPHAPIPRSAALSIYEDAFELSQALPEREIGSSMVLTWGLDTAQAGLLWEAEDDEEKEARKDAHLISFDDGEKDEKSYCTSDDSDWTLFKRAQARAVMRSLSRPLCVFHRTIHASELYDMTTGELKEAFGDKVVMIGTSLRYSNDIVVSPLHDRIPGVFLHAMALDNLLTSRGRYQEHWEPPSRPSDKRWLPFAGLCLMGLLPIVLVRAGKELVERQLKERRKSQEQTPGPNVSPAPPVRSYAYRKLRDVVIKIGRFLISGVALIVFAVVFLVVGQHVMHVPFLPVSHLVACALALEWVEWGPDFANWILDVKEEKS